jgi:DNA-binding transcriptional ArsR family regulator
MGNVEVKDTLPTRPYLPAEPLDTAHAVDALAALAQPTRLAVFRRLVEFAPDGLNAGAIGAALGLAPPTLSFHLKELVNAGLVVDQREGRHIRYRADLAAMNALIGYLTDNCCRGQGRLVDSAECAPACAPSACAPNSPRATRRR